MLHSSLGQYTTHTFQPRIQSNRDSRHTRHCKRAGVRIEWSRRARLTNRYSWLPTKVPIGSQPCLLENECRRHTKQTVDQQLGGGLAPLGTTSSLILSSSKLSWPMEVWNSKAQAARDECSRQRDLTGDLQEKDGATRDGYWEGPGGKNPLAGPVSPRTAITVTHGPFSLWSTFLVEATTTNGGVNNKPHCRQNLI
jgi:hypothetical protein